MSISELYFVCCFCRLFSDLVHLNGDFLVHPPFPCLVASLSYLLVFFFSIAIFIMDRYNPLV